MEVRDDQLLSFFNWLGPAAGIWLLGVCGLLLAVLAIGFLFSVIRYGPGRAGEMLVGTIGGTLADLTMISPRRVWALTKLAMQESFRRRVWVALVLFIVILGFAGWFLDPQSPDPAKLYLGFVLTATSFLILLLALFMSVLSLPHDIKTKTIYTIVTKPVRPSEIVLGRILGFTAVGTILLAIMGTMSYVFVVRSLNHSHELVASDVKQLVKPNAAGEYSVTPDTIVAEGKTSLDRHHRHRVFFYADGSITTDIEHGHWHEVLPAESLANGEKQYTIGPSRGAPAARVPVYGELRYRDRSGGAGTGDNVGYIWEYRRYVEGATQAAAIWKFTGLTEEQFPDGLPLELTIEIFRTRKGNVDLGVLGELVLKNPKTQLQCDPIQFRAREYQAHTEDIPLTLPASTGRTTIDLFDQLVDNGELEIEMRCSESGQFFGAAQADLYILKDEASFAANLAKGYLGLWLQMALINTVGVFFSTFLNAAVSFLGTISTIVMGFRVEFMRKLSEGDLAGGGPAEALSRTFTGRSLGMDLDEGLGTDAIQGVDFFLLQPVLRAMSYALPDLKKFSDIDFVSYGYDIPIDRLLIQTVSAIGYMLPVFLLAYLFLKTREVAK